VPNRSTLITGGSRGLGFAMAKHLAGCGHRVAITGRDEKAVRRAVDALPPGAIGLCADAGVESDVQSVVQAVLDQFGQIDVLINNAGVSGSMGMTWELSVEQWWQVQETNLKGPLLHMQKVLPGMVQRGSGTIINVGSYAAINSIPGNSAYGTSKAALAKLTEGVAQETRDHGIDVFCVSPGLVLTDMTRDVPVFRDIPESEWSQPEDIAKLSQRLIEEDCSALSGRFIHVRDDFDALLRQSERIGKEGLYALGLNTLDDPG
jgi:3-oxoacyl-[acyl-carrier protein] reductase